MVAISDKVDSVQINSIHKHVKHPLQHKWMFWFNKITRGSAFEADLVRVKDFKTVEDFWSLFHHIKHPSELSNNQDYSFFKINVPPKWEDQQNINGGRWIVDIPISTYKQDDIKSDKYLKLLLLIFGDELGADTEFVNGIICGRRRETIRIGVWLNIIDERAKNIGHKLGTLLEFPSYWFFESFKSVIMRETHRGALRERLYQFDF